MGRLTCVLILLGMAIVGSDPPAKSTESTPVPQTTISTMDALDALDKEKRLIGLEAVRVRVYCVDDGAFSGLHHSLKNRLELRVRQAGIRIAEEDANFRIPALAFLTKSNCSNGKPSCIYDAELVLTEYAVIARTQRLAWLSSWKGTGTYGVGSPGHVRDSIRESLETQLDEFLNDYLKANPTE